METKIGRKKYKKLIYIAVAIVTVAAIVVGVGFLWLYSYCKKENNLLLFQPNQGEQEIYILGTIHNRHYNKLYNYSVANIQSVIDTIKPDILLVEVRQETVEKYGALDGPSEMVFAWSYAEEIGMDVKGVDWWQISETQKANTTNDQRDEHIFENILSSIEGKQKVLILCGATHRIEQGKLFAGNGYTERKLQNIKQYFNSVSVSDFQYPQAMVTKFNEKIDYFRTGLVEEIKNNTAEGSKGQKYWLSRSRNNLSTWENMRDELFIPNQLFHVR